MTKEERLLRVSQAKQKKFQESIKHVNLDELKNLYLVENQSYEFIRNKYNLTGYTLDKILRENNIKKPRKQSAALVLETKYTNAGSKEEYDKKTYQKTCANIIAKGITLEQHYAEVGNRCSAAWKNKSDAEINQFINKLNNSYFSHPDKIEHAKSQRVQTNIQKHGVDNTFKLATYVSDSGPNKEFYKLLSEKDVTVESEVFLPSNNLFTLKGFRYDFKLNNILIELNPWPFHNSTWSPIPSQPPLQKDYHYNKTIVACEHGFRCIHVWDWDDKLKIVESITKPKIRVFAKQCKVVQIDDQTVINSFLNAYHYQNTCKGQTNCYGLYYGETLIQLMTFGKPRYNKNYEWELLRLCTAFDYIIVGGAQKLFNYFIKACSPYSIISYCDNSKFKGDVYNNLGMSLLSYGSPTRHWYHSKLNKHVTDNYLRQRGFDQLFGNIFGVYGKGTNNNELMIQHGFVEVYDCGQSTYAWCDKETL